MKLNNVRPIVVTAVVLVTGIATFFVGPARAAIEAVMSCAQSTPCLEWDNTRNGEAVKGVSTNGNALHGQTKFKSAGKTSGKSGVFGEDLSTSGNRNAGVSGTSVNGSGVIGTSTSWNGMEGFTAGPGTSGVYGQSSTANGFGVAGRNTATTAGSGAGVFGDGGPNIGVYGHAEAGVGVYSYSANGTSLHINQGPSTSADELWLQGNNTTGHFLFDATDQNSNTLFYIQSGGTTAAQGVFVINANRALGPPFDISAATHQNLDVARFFNDNEVETTHITDTGNVYITGELFSAGPCQSGCAVGGKPVRAVETYASMSAEPTIEDDGEATLVDGRADVALDPRFANIIDATRQYLVSVTPEGDCRGLFVANRTARGFSVRELQGGRGNVAFEYRVLAKRYGLGSGRLPMTVVQYADPSLRLAGRHGP